jgi:autotransporter-associated beta strand protein
MYALHENVILGRAIGQTTPANAYQVAASQLYTNFNLHFWNAADQAYNCAFLNGNALAPTAHAQLIALDRGLVPPARVASTRAWLLANYKNPGGFHVGDNPDYQTMINNKAGINMTVVYYWMFLELYRMDTAAMDLEVINEMRRRWTPMVNFRQDTGTVTETFVNNSGGGGDESCHNYGAVPAYFMSSYLLGVRLDGPVWVNKLKIEPRLGDLTSAEGVVVTEHGPVPVKWSRTGQNLAFSCTIPAATTATIRLPMAPGAITQTFSINGQAVVNPVIEGRFFTTTLGPGAYQFSVATQLDWQGDGAVNQWDKLGLSWKDAAGIARSYLDGVSTNFRDTGSNQPLINFTEALAPAAVTVDASLDYTFGGSGSLTGPMTLTKKGSGTLTLKNANTFAGGTELIAGTLLVETSQALSNRRLIASGGTLAIATSLSHPGRVEISSSLPARIDTRGYDMLQNGDIIPLANAAGGLTKAGNGTLTLQGTQSYSGPTLIVAGTLKLGTTFLPPALPGLLYRLDASNAASMTLAGSNIAEWRDSAASSYSFSQATATAQPTLIPNALSGKSVVRINGAQQLLLPTATAPREVMAITTVSTSATPLGGLLGTNRGDTGLRLYNNVGSWAGDGGATQINGTSTQTYTAGTPHLLSRYATTWESWPETGLGQYFYNPDYTDRRYFKGDLAELLVFSTELTAAQRLELRTFLTAKWLGGSYPLTAKYPTLPSTTQLSLAASNAVFDVGAAVQTIASLSGVAGSRVQVAGGSLMITSDNPGDVFAGTISGNGTLTNAGTLRFGPSTTLSFTGPFTNSGILDLRNWSGTLPASFVNTGTVLTNATSPPAPKFLSIQPPQTNAGVMTLTWASIPAVSYRIEESVDMKVCATTIKLTP